MAQEQPKKEAGKPDQQHTFKYGDVFYVSGQAENKPVLPEDASSMESAEKIVMGHSPYGGPASSMRTTAEANVQAGLVDPNSRRTTEGIRVTESGDHGTRIVTESVNDEVVGQFIEPQFAESTTPKVTIGETLDAVALYAGDQPIDDADAAAIAAAEKRAVGADPPPGWGLGAEARYAADRNVRAPRPEFMTTLDDVLKDASHKLARDKAVTTEDAKVVMEAEVCNNPEMTTTIAGVGEMMSAAARLNQTTK
ncbi:hypothetical protein SOVF_022140 [Spinacia oleracea]|uniref:Late embryogenesis abundant protein D-34-like n=1 Tax=Spinacia oleracea TaxID=3562 RepID=A0A9R0I3H2_SPIOL|nr:late embryogenesis abundant protein D-34-like [Spinacia oleracea]KNA23750.1 hypothetical protein SOVF_022140 [Spinacia oleracea]